MGLKPEVAEMYPHELSGGMKQRVCIATAISLQPKVIIADEPTSALDVVVQKQVMETLGQVQQDLEASVILVGHDMGLMAQFVDKVGIMYAGKLVEVGPVEEIFRGAAASLHAPADRHVALPGRQGGLQGHPRHDPLAARSPAWVCLLGALPRRAVTATQPGSRSCARFALDDGLLAHSTTEASHDHSSGGRKALPRSSRSGGIIGGKKRITVALDDASLAIQSDPPSIDRHRRRERQRQDHAVARVAGPDPTQQG